MNIFFILFGGIFIVLGIIIAIRLCYLKKVCTFETKATVIKIAKTKKRGLSHYKYSGNKKVFKMKCYTPIFQYFLREEVTLKTLLKNSPYKEVPLKKFLYENRILKKYHPTYAKFAGSKVKLFYNPDNIKTYYVAEHTLTGIPFILFGILFIFLGTYY